MKEISDTDYIRSLIAQGEHQQQDFKFEISDICKIAKTLSAFANTDGGRLLIGVKDNGKIAGVRTEEEQYMIQAAAEVYCRPQVEFRMQNFTIEGKTVLMAEICRSNLRPVYAKTEDGRYLAYIRVKDENILASPIHLQVWQQGDSPHGELLEYTEREHRLLSLLQQNDRLTLNQCYKQSHIQRFAAQRLLARFIRYGIIEAVFEDHKFFFRLKS